MSMPHRPSARSFQRCLAGTALLFTFLLTPASVYSQERTFRDVLLEQISRYPKMQVQDVYKLIFQASLGNEHLMRDTTAVRRYLDEELGRVRADGAEPLIEFLTPDSSLVRLNLRPFKARGGSIDSLAAAMVRTSAEFRPSKLNLLKYWGQFEDLIARKKVPFKRADTDRYYRKITKERYPAVHHSPLYAGTYRPAYRVILRDTLGPWKETTP